LSGTGITQIFNSTFDSAATGGSVTIVLSTFATYLTGVHGSIDVSGATAPDDPKLYVYMDTDSSLTINNVGEFSEIYVYGDGELTNNHASALIYDYRSRRFSVETEEHLHNLGIPLPTIAASSFTAIASNGAADTFGAWTQVATAAQMTTALGAAALYFDANQIALDNATANRDWTIEFGYGDGTVPGTKVVARTFFISRTGVATLGTLNMTPAVHQAIDGSSNFYARCQDDTGGGTMDIRPVVHRYPAIE